MTRAADCEVCHTAKDGIPFAGGRAFVLPFGTLYSTNITPDAETGIGNYNDEETQSQFGMLDRLKCDQIQGFLLGRPMPKASVDRLLQIAIVPAHPVVCNKRRAAVAGGLQSAQAA